MARSRYRSVTYHLDASVELARAVSRAGGRTDMATLAAALSYSGVRNGAFLTRLANARLFGLVAGRSGEVTLAERGRRCLSADPAEARRARAAACLAVPLFRDVLQLYADTAVPVPEILAEVLQAHFGETANLAASSARVLIESAGQAGLLAGDGVVRSQVTASATDFTDSRLVPRPGFTPPVGWARGSSPGRARGRRQRRAGQGGHTMVDQGPVTPGATNDPDRGGLWLDEGTPPVHSRNGSRRAWVTVGAAACLLVVGVPVGLLVAGSTGPSSPHLPPPSKVAVRLGGGPAERSVLAALSATTDSGSFSFTYNLSESPATASTTTTLPPCTYAGGGAPVATPCGTSSPGDVAVQGSGTINVNPMAMAASADISQNENAGMQVGVRVDATSVWEVSNTDNGLTPQSVDNQGAGSGPSLPGFAGITEATLGQREGAVAMMGMASPTGYLDLVQPAVTGAAQLGSSTVDGVAVTQYELAIDPSSLSTAPGVSSAEASTITAAVAVLTSERFTTIRDLVSIDASGFIRESSSTVSFSDGGTVTLDAHFSNFGCAGTVLMPGQAGVSNPPANCSTPDTGLAPATTTTSTATTSTPTTSSTSVVTPTTTSSTTSTPTTSTPVPGH